MRGYGHRSKYLCAGSDIDVAFQDGYSTATVRPDRHLLEKQAIHPDDGVWMNHDPIGMRHQKPAPNVAS
ncbi:hypothetical protein [Bradyrhizobium sp. AS23.2]|uniref:hypothetical protein n=1 Tax=Bradyrhizobium sp. AS23.2 TaxID=1680155 RepID=UPI00143190F9|nr:hypothetical protein [Bradyrhizobium sp. AS23.2]